MPRLCKLGRSIAGERSVHTQFNSVRGYQSGNATQTWVMVTDGYLKKKNWLTPGIRIAQKRPITQARKVDASMVGSSVLATADRTSGYGDSSSSATAVGSKFGSSVSPERPYGCVRWVNDMKGQKKADLETADVLRGALLEVIGPLLVIRERHW